jgi:hypothetical protein
MEKLEYSLDKDAANENLKHTSAKRSLGLKKPDLLQKIEESRQTNRSI